MGAVKAIFTTGMEDFDRCTVRHYADEFANGVYLDGWRYSQEAHRTAEVIDMVRTALAEAPDAAAVWHVWNFVAHLDDSMRWLITRILRSNTAKRA